MFKSVNNWFSKNYHYGGDNAARYKPFNRVVFFLLLFGLNRDAGTSVYVYSVVYYLRLRRSLRLFVSVAVLNFHYLAHPLGGVVKYAYYVAVFVACYCYRVVRGAIYETIAGNNQRIAGVFGRYCVRCFARWHAGKDYQRERKK